MSQRCEGLQCFRKRGARIRIPVLLAVYVSKIRQGPRGSPGISRFSMFYVRALVQLPVLLGQPLHPDYFLD